jgi:hypothetical protein
MNVDAINPGRQKAESIHLDKIDCQEKILPVSPFGAFAKAVTFDHYSFDD